MTIFLFFCILRIKKHEKGIEKKKGRSVGYLGRLSTERPRQLKTT